MAIMQTASKEQIKRAKRKAGKPSRHAKIFRSFKELAPLAHIYDR